MVFKIIDCTFSFNDLIMNKRTTKLNLFKVSADSKMLIYDNKESFYKCVYIFYHTIFMLSFINIKN